MHAYLHLKCCSAASKSPAFPRWVCHGAKPLAVSGAKALKTSKASKAAPRASKKAW